MNKKVFKLDGKGCASCASKIEDKINRLPGISFISVNFIIGKMIIESDSDISEELSAEAIKIVNKYEPRIKVVAQ